jgi:hypothetical protein
MGWTVRGSNPGGSEIFHTCADRPWGLPSLLYNGYRVYPGVNSGRGVTLTPHPLLVPWSWKGRAISLLPLWAVRPVQSLSACTRVTFTFFTFLKKEWSYTYTLASPKMNFMCYLNIGQDYTPVISVMCMELWYSTLAG